MMYFNCGQNQIAELTFGMETACISAYISCVAQLAQYKLEQKYFVQESQGYFKFMCQSEYTLQISQFSRQLKVNSPEFLCCAFVFRSMNCTVSSSSQGPSAYTPDATQPQAYCTTLNTIQYRFNNPMPCMRRQRSVTKAVLVSLGSAVSLTKTL